MEEGRWKKEEQKLLTVSDRADAGHGALVSGADEYGAAATFQRMLDAVTELVAV
jgi:hypothetical protein